MAKVLHEKDEIRRETSRVLASGQPARAAVAFWGRGAETALGLSATAVRSRGLEIICDLKSGCCNPDTIRKLMGWGASIRSIQKMHAKVYLGAHEVVLGSANASSNGLGLEGCEINGSKELCLLTNEPGVVFQCQSWFAELWKSEQDIGDKDIEEAQALWFDRRNHRGWATHDNDLLTVLQSDDVEQFLERKIFVRVDTLDVTKPAIKRAKQEIGGDLSKHGIFEDWDDMPKSAEVIEFLWEDGKSIKLDGIYLTPVCPPAAKLETQIGSTIVTCQKLDSVGGSYKIPIRGETAKAWKRAAEAYASDKRRPKEGCFISLYDFAKDFLTACYTRS